MAQWLEQIKWNDQGLVPAIAQDHQSKRVLMMAWMNKQALQLTIEQRQAVYWSRSRQALWYKGETSGNVQDIKEIRLDCDNDVVLIEVHQHGGVACHTGRNSCFYQRWQGGGWEVDGEVLRDPKEMYQ